MYPAAAAILAACLTLTIGCDHFSSTRGLNLEHDGIHGVGRATDADHIWKKTATPSPLPIVRLVPGQEKRVSLMDATPHADFRITAAQADSPIGCTLILQSDALIVRAEPGSKGRTLVQVAVDGDAGPTSIVVFPVLIDPLPVVEFTYEPKGKAADRVFVAGSFNGWNNSADELVKDSDGVFRLSKAVPPGSHTYKLVVDGNWMADPENPEQDSSGYGNSVLRVEGEVAGKFDFDILPAGMRGTGSQGGFFANLPSGTAINPATITLLVNNKRRRIGEWSVNPQTGVISLNVPESDWLPENFITLIAEATDGSRGLINAPFTYSHAPRSPRDEVIYYPLTDRFRDGDPSNNPSRDLPNVHPLAQYHGGDWAGIIEKLETGYFTDLGVTTLWISPPYENTMKVEQESVEPGRYFTSYHGYWPISSEATNPAFGTMEDLRRLVSTAHSLGIAVILDYVSNHVHEDHPLYKNDPTIGTPLKLPNGQNNIRQFDAHPFTTWFDTFLPTLDYDSRPDLIGVMTDNALYWLRETGADGFRHDAVKHVPLPFWRELTRKLRVEFEAREGRKVYQVGETISGHSTVSEFVGPDLLDGQFDFPLYFAVQNALARRTAPMSDLAEALRNGEIFYPPSAIMSPLLGNHDVARFMAYADGDLPPGIRETEVGYTNPPSVDKPESYEALQLGFAFLAAAPGPPTIYYGDEIGMTGAQDPDNRRFMKWDDWSAEEQKTFDRAAEFNRLRHNNIALRRGALRILHSDRENLVIARVAPEQIVIASFTRNALRMPTNFELPAAWKGLQLRELLTDRSNATSNGEAIVIYNAVNSWGFWEATW
jgi:glycosidase